MNAILPFARPMTQPTVIEPKNQSPFENLFFPVAVVPAGAVIDDELVSSEYQAVIRTDTHQVLGIHGMAYKLLSNQDAFNAFDEALYESSLDLSDMRIKNEMSHNGGRAYRTYNFPAHSIAIGRKNDLVNLKLQVSNSYDASLAFSTRLGGYRLLCTNGMVIGTTFMHQSMKHTKALDLGNVVSRLNQAIGIYLDSSSEWQRWSRRRISQEQAKNIIEAFPGSNDKLHTLLLDTYQQETAELGPTVWALFNALTHYSTHHGVRRSSEGNAASIRLQRENRVQSLISSPEWQRLAA